MADGITHEDVATAADDPLAEINKAEWNKAHKVTGSITITGGTAEPARPASGIIIFTIDTGVTPNHRMAAGMLVSDINIPPIYWFDVTT